MQELLPGTEVEARGLRWEVVFAERLGPQTLYRLRGLEGAVQGQELDLLHPFEPLHRLVHDFQPEKAAPLRNWLVYHQVFLLEQALGTDALLAVQPGRLRLEPYQLVPVLRAIRMNRLRLLLADGVGLGKTVNEMALRCCYSFENRHPLFEIHRSFKFATVVASRTGPATDFPCAFYLHDDEWLFTDHREPPSLSYSSDCVRRVGGEYLSFPECRSQIDADLLGVLYGERNVDLGSFLQSHGRDFSFGVELHRNRAFNNPMTRPQYGDDLSPTKALSLDTWVPIFERKAFGQYTDRGESPVRVRVPLRIAVSKKKWNPSIAYFRLTFREVAASTNERTLICTVLQPGVLCNHTAGVETIPHKRSNCGTLTLCALLNSYFVDWQVRQKAGTHVSAFIFRATCLPDFRIYNGFLAHSALRLTCNHAGYAPLWCEQLGDIWRELRPSFTWPVLLGEDERWWVRAAIDAIVADAYGLSREQYAHVLSTFSHRSYPRAPELCLACYDDLKAIGVEAFTRKYDPYWDIPLNENLPEPVIDLPSPEDITEEEQLPILVAAQAATEVVPVERPTKLRESRERGNDVSPTDRHVLLLCRVIDKHRGTTYESTLGSVKAEKISHIVESHLGIDLGRAPVRDAAGPVDYPHLRGNVFHRAKRRYAFEARQREGGIGHYFVPLNGLGKALRQSTEVFGEKVAEIDRIIELFLPMNSDQAEVVATLYAAWNDLLAAGVEPTAEHIFSEFYAWDEQKQRFDRSRLEGALAWMREHGLVPTGTGKRTTLER